MMYCIQEHEYRLDHISYVSKVALYDDDTMGFTIQLTNGKEHHHSYSPTTDGMLGQGIFIKIRNDLVYALNAPKATTVKGQFR